MTKITETDIEFLTIEELEALGNQYLHGQDIAPDRENAERQRWDEVLFKDPEAVLQEKVDDYTQKFSTPYRAAHRGYIDEVIKPEETRKKLITAFKMLENKVDKLPKKKHGNMPL